ncbi:retrovirus-related pol polyprotein from transposon TNT 1-94 [Tanacetum coccineum]
MQQSQPNKNYIPQPSFNTNSMQQQMPNLDDISDLTTTMNMALVLMTKAFKLNYSTPNNNNQRKTRNRLIAQLGMNMGQDRQMQMVGGNGGNQFRQYVGQNAGNQIRYNVGQITGNQNGYNAVQNVRNQVGKMQFRIQNGNGNVIGARAEGNGNGNNINQVRCYNCRGMGHFARNCIIKPKRMDAAYLQTQLLIAQKEEAGIQLQVKEFDLMAAAGDIYEIEEVNANCILMANLQQASTLGTQTDKAPVYDSDGSAEETRAYFESLYNNLAIEVEKVNTVNRKMRETNADLTTELARYRGQEKSFEINKAKFDELETEENKKLKSDFKTREDELLDKLIQSEKKIKELDNIWVKTGQSIQMMHMLSPKADLFYYTEQKMALGYQNPFYLKQAQQKQHSLYNGRVLLKKHDPSTVYDSDETLQLTQEIRIDNTTKTRRPQPRSNTKNYRATSASKSNCIKNKEVKVEEHHRNLLLSKNQKHMSFACNNIKLVIQNDKSEVVCAKCKQCLITAIHDVCLLNYVKDMNSYADNQNANVSNVTNQKKHKPKVKKPKKSGDSEYRSNCSKGDNACTSNPQERTSKRFPNSTSFLGRALCYPKNDHEAIRKLGAKGDIGFFVGYSTNSCAYRVYNRRTRKIMETMNVTFDELSDMAFEQRSLKPELQGMTSRQISSGLDLTYAPS